MNVERLTKLAEWLEAGAPHVRFDMRTGVAYTTGPDYKPACVTSCCLAGAAVQFFANEEDKDLLRERFYRDAAGPAAPWSRVRDEACRLLGLDKSTADSLFTPKGMFNSTIEGRFDNRFNDPTLAARVVREFAATGKVKWHEFMAETQP